MMYPKENWPWRRISEFCRWKQFVGTVCKRVFVTPRWQTTLALLAACGFQTAAQAAALMEEGFNYPAGSRLATNSPWAGTGNASVAIVSGSLSITNLRNTVPPGNQLQITGTATASARRNFSPTAVTSSTATDVYCAFLINCPTAIASQQFVMAMLPSGATGASPPDDAVDVYLIPATGGYTFMLTSVGSDPSAAGTILAPGTTHLIVVKYEFGTLGTASLYIDPPPGGTEPLNPDIQVGADDNVGPSNLQVILFRSTAGLATCYFDTIRAGINWSDVAPLVVPLTLQGPFSQAVCSGSPVTFTVTANGTPPYTYQWRTNGVAIPGAISNSFTLASAGPKAALNYDVVVGDSYGSSTSQVATLAVTTTSASIAKQPTAPVVTPTPTNAVFTVTAAGDAPISYQWRTNGVAILGATNSTYTLTNPTTADPTVHYDVMVSNPCGGATSTTVSLRFASVFYPAYDAGPGFFSGENLVVTNAGGLVLYGWSSLSLSVPVSQWTLEGTLQEQPLNDGTGRSLYSINVTPAASPEYYVFGNANTSPYLPPIPILTLTTDPSGFYIVASSQMGISGNGTLGTASLQLIATPHPGGGLDLTGSGIAGNTYLLQTATNFQIPAAWVTLQTNIADSTGLVHFIDTNGPSPFRFYRLLGQ